MISLVRNSRRVWHRLLDSRKINIEGVWLNTDPKLLTPTLRRRIFSGAYEIHERKITKQILNEHSIVLEIGTGIGLISIFSKLIAKNGRVVSYEANPNIESVIRANYELNGLEPELEMKAVTVDGKDIEFFIDDNVLSSSKVDRNRGDTKTIVPSVKIGKILKELRPDTIIMDVEGAEIELLSNQDLGNVQNIVVEIHPHIVGREAIAGMDAELKESGFKAKLNMHKVHLYSRS